MIQKKVMVFIFIFSISFLAQNIFVDNLWAADC